MDISFDFKEEPAAAVVDDATFSGESKDNKKDNRAVSSMITTFVGAEDMAGLEKQKTLIQKWFSSAQDEMASQLHFFLYVLLFEIMGDFLANTKIQLMGDKIAKWTCAMCLVVVYHSTTSSRFLYQFHSRFTEWTKLPLSCFIA